MDSIIFPEMKVNQALHDINKYDPDRRAPTDVVAGTIEHTRRVIDIRGNGAGPIVMAKLANPDPLRYEYDRIEGLIKYHIGIDTAHFADDETIISKIHPNGCVEVLSDKDHESGTNDDLGEK